MKRAKRWYVLAVANSGAELLRCTEAGFDRVKLLDQVASDFEDEREDVMSADVAQTGGRFVPTSTGSRTGQHTPRATFTNNDVASRGAFTEQYLGSLGQAVRDHVDTERTTLLVTMDEARFALFQAVSGLDEVAMPLDVAPNMTSNAQLWELSRERMREQWNA